MNRRRASLVTGIVLTAFGLLAGCADSSGTSPAIGSSDGTVAPPTDASTTESFPVPASTSPEAPTPHGSTPVSSDQIDPGLQPYIDIAVADLAERLSIDATQITVTSATLEEWSDSALGCPQPGQQYAQVSTDGSLIVLTTESRAYRYHAGGSRTPFLCEITSKAPPITGFITP